jgi:leader peptidase (prepilin peptidase)/N-methyltransferase
MGIPVLLVTSLLTATTAGALTPWLRKLARSDSGWISSRTHVLLAALGGLGAATLAHGWAELVAFALLALTCAMLVVVDLAVYRLPDVIVGPMYPILAVAFTIQTTVDGDWSRLGRAAIAGGVLALSYLVLVLLVPSGMGLGDVKLAGLLGVFLGWTGWPNVLVGTVAAFTLNGVVAAVLLVSRHATRKSAIAFGPWMVAGAAIGALWAPSTLGLLN